MQVVTQWKTLSHRYKNTLLLAGAAMVIFALVSTLHAPERTRFVLAADEAEPHFHALHWPSALKGPTAERGESTAHGALAVSRGLPAEAEAYHASPPGRFAGAVARVVRLHIAGMYSVLACPAGSGIGTRPGWHGVRQIGTACEPWINREAVQLLDLYLASHMVGLEWSSGSSTRWLLQRVRALYSVEHDAAWLRSVEGAITAKDASRWSRAQVPCASLQSCPPYSAYPAASTPPGNFNGFDFISVDGVVRDDCMRTVLKSSLLQPYGVVLLDNAERTTVNTVPPPHWLTVSFQNAIDETAFWMRCEPSDAFCIRAQSDIDAAMALAKNLHGTRYKRHLENRPTIAPQPALEPAPEPASEPAPEPAPEPALEPAPEPAPKAANPVALRSRMCVAISIFFIDAEHHKTYGIGIPAMVRSIKRLDGAWTLWVFTDDTIRPSLVAAINDAARHAGVTLLWKHMPRNHGRSGTFWRFYAHDQCSFTIFRDAELVFEPNDDFILRHFFATSHPFAAVQLAHERTWAQHRPVLAGTYMMKNLDHKINMTALVNAWPYWHYYGADEVFIAHSVHPLRPSIIYYEPREKIINSVRLNGLEHYETYVPLPACYSSTPPCSSRKNPA